jgi:hypothetical protein
MKNTHTFIALCMAFCLLQASALSEQAGRNAGSPQPSGSASQQPPESADETEPEAAIRPLSAAEWGSMMVGFLKSDSDHQSVYGMKLAEAFLLSNEFETAVGIAKLLQDYRKAVLLYRVAELAARSGEKQLAQTCVDDAEREPARKFDNERDAIHHARVRTLAALGRIEDARDALGNIGSIPTRRLAEAELFEFDSDPEATDRVLTFALREAVPPSQRGRALFRVAKSRLLQNEKKTAEELLERCVKVASTMADIDTIPLLRDVVDLYLQLGRQQQAAQWAEVSLGFAERTDKRAYWKTRDLRLAAESLLAAGESDKAKEVFDIIPNFTAELDAFSYSRGAIEAADACLAAGDEQRYFEACAHIVRMARHHPHFRARAMGAVDVLTSLVRNRKELPEIIETELREAAKSIETDPGYLNPV